MELNQALRIFLRVGLKDWAPDDRAGVITAFGPEEGGRLAQQIEQILKGVRYEPGDTLPQPTLEQSWLTSEQALRRAHPELSDEVVEAIRNHFFFGQR